IACGEQSSTQAFRVVDRRPAGSPLGVGAEESDVEELSDEEEEERLEAGASAGQLEGELERERRGL
ncbi:MAG: hypothetical protein KDE27_17000, partial [Planctomycetes bacterium]|nr:hypothetical protein [Planctomycetota bacterium]